MNKYKIKYYCKCGNKIHWTTALYGSGLCKPCVNKGEKNRNYTDGHTSIQHYCELCNKEITCNAKKCHSCANKGRKQSPIAIKRKIKSMKKFYNSSEGKQYLKQLSINMSGKNNPMFGVIMTGKDASNWQGGIGNDPYPLEFNEELKEQIRHRDDYKCQVCHKKESKLYRFLDIHHIDYNKENCKEENLISLCHNCHMKTNGNRDFYYAYFTEIIEQIYIKI